VMYFFFFFFQAEDGIRDRTVTGVQTCALPIYVLRLHGETSRVELRLQGAAQVSRLHDVWIQSRVRPGRVALVSHAPILPVADRRSEERRVGKECRSRGAGGRVEKEVTVER